MEYIITKVLVKLYNEQRSNNKMNDIKAYKMKKSLVHSLVVGALAASAVAGCSNTTTEENNITLRDKIAQKLIIDMRYYCPVLTEKYCRTPMTKLHPDLANVITESNLGGIILFADNLVNAEQTIELNYDLQQAAKASKLGIPLFITVDQEGGRVFRTARHETTAFTGNMALGATYADRGAYFADKSAEVIAKELKVLGFNVNHAPTVDVNSNPKNPVINVRSYSENPDVVAELGQAQIDAFQRNGIIGTLKHFPGHGDTSTDSHVGLPRVDHDLETIHRLDVGPYKAILKKNAPGMIMTTHIQYPTLDSSTYTSKEGKSIIKPATMSRKIMTDFLRGELGYEGVIVTDAMDMAGISHFFEKDEAIINVFRAGVDISEMGIKIRTSEDLNNLNIMLDKLTAAVESGRISEKDIDDSFERIQKLKKDYNLIKEFDGSVAERIKIAKQVIGSPEHRKLEAEISVAAVTQVTGEAKDLVIANNEKVHLIMPDTSKCMAIKSALSSAIDGIEITCTSALSFDAEKAANQISQADVVIGAHIAPRQSAAEMGGMDDLKGNKARSLKVAGSDVIYNLLDTAKQQKKRTIFVSLRTPYEIEHFKNVADATIATYSYNTYREAVTEKLRSPALEGLAQVLAGKAPAKGVSPVTVEGL